MNPQLIQQGAEAVITLENHFITKHRIKKSYRLKDLDEKLRFKRTKSEAKIINKLSGIIPVPKIINSYKENIFMEFIDGQKLSEALENLEYKQICKQIAENITKIHNQDIIHGDLTTSNMIYVKNSDEKSAETLLKELPPNQEYLDINNKITAEQASKRSLWSRQSKKDDEQSKVGKGKVYFIDFGLSFHSHKIEDKAVDLHLLQQALEAKHYKIASQAIKIILKNYKANQSKQILERIKAIEKRGRYKGH